MAAFSEEEQRETADCISCKTAHFPSGMTQQLKQARHAASLSVVRKDLTQSSLEALVDSDTCKHGKVSGIRELLRGCSQWRQLKLLPCLIAQSLCQVAVLTYFIYMKRLLA